MRNPAFAPLVLLAGVGTALAQEAPVPHPDQVAAGIGRAVEVLLERQERYSRDRPIGTLPEEELEAWQARERERLATGRAENSPGAEWPYEGVYRVRGAIPTGYRVGGTSIACLGLLGAPGYADDEARRAAVERALRFVLERIEDEDDPQFRAGPKRGYDVRGWGHAYALRLLLVATDADAVPDDLIPRVEDAVPHLLNCLEVNAHRSGGWNYADDQRVSPFMTGSTLLTLYLARARGHAVDPEMVTAAHAALKRARTAEVSYAYAGSARGPVPMPGSSARSAVAELALFLAGESDTEALRRAVDGFFDGWEQLLARKSRQGTHEGRYGIAPYYFFFGHTYAALAIEQLPEEDRQALRQRLYAVLWRTRDADGSWNDRVFPRTSSYSTAMVLLALLAPTGEGFPAWAKQGG